MELCVSSLANRPPHPPTHLSPPQRKENIFDCYSLFQQECSTMALLTSVGFSIKYLDVQNQLSGVSWMKYHELVLHSSPITANYYCVLFHITFTFTFQVKTDPNKKKKPGSVVLSCATQTLTDIRGLLSSSCFLDAVNLMRHRHSCVHPLLLCALAWPLCPCWASFYSCMDSQAEAKWLHEQR